MAEQIDLPLGLWTRVGRRKHKLNRIRQVAPMCPHGRAHWRHLENTIEPNVIKWIAHQPLCGWCYLFTVSISVCLSACLSVNNFAQKLPSGFRDLHEISREGWQLVNEQITQLWLRSGSPSGYRNCFPDSSSSRINRLRCATLQCWVAIAIATMTSLRHRPLAEVCTVTVRSELRKVLFLALSDFFGCIWNISETAERISGKCAGKTCLIPRSDEFEGQSQRSKVKVTRDINGIFRPFRRSVCGLCLIEHL